jgi:hypothetical protein
MNGSTLDCDGAVDIAMQKAEGCLHQIVQRDIPVFTNSILTPEEMANIVYQEIHSSAFMTNGNCVETIDIQKLGHFATRFV